jgi:hypothetical protein
MWRKIDREKIGLYRNALHEPITSCISPEPPGRVVCLAPQLGACRTCLLYNNMGTVRPITSFPGSGNLFLVQTGQERNGSSKAALLGEETPAETLG